MCFQGELVFAWDDQTISVPGGMKLDASGMRLL
jgi:hypothetical protein